LTCPNRSLGGAVWGGMSVSSLIETDTLTPIYECLNPRG